MRISPTQRAKLQRLIGLDRAGDGEACCCKDGAGKSTADHQIDWRQCKLGAPALTMAEATFAGFT